MTGRKIRDERDYCTVEYGGGGTYKGWGGMIHTTSDRSGVMVSIKNSKIQHSAVYCILQGPDRR